MIGTLLSSRYRLESKLGSGGMSTVYLAEDETLDRPVAVKVLHREISDEPDQLERFRLEARSAAKLSHPNLVTVIDAGEDGGTPYIVFEYVDGETLKQRIQREGPLGVDESVAYAIEIGRGLQAAHARRLVHRDIKPQNVLIDREGRAKVADFGIARSLEQHGMTAPGRVLGTTDYVSPEQAMGEDVDERSDVYSLGIVLYEMLTGDVPFQAETQVGVAMKHVNDPMPDVQAVRPEVSAAVAGVVDRATSKDLDQRYWSVADMVDDLEATLEVEAARGGGTSGQATAVLDSVPRKRRTLAPGRASGAGIAMGLLGVGLIVAALIVGEKQLASDNGGGAITLSPDAAHAFDPPPDGDSEEHSSEARLAVDGNPTGTSWPTETYETDDINGKPGVGIYVDAGKPVKASAIDVRASASGWDAEVRAAPGQDSAPSSLGGWSVVGSGSDLGTRAKIRIEGGGESRFYLLWLTKLPPTDGGYNLEISDIKLLN
ncbi:MAG: eukaryotic-like serine/threonine-protein kinase [Solirubrobacterales bacterium]|nr:eukaryotic-like serine/threonine-protein kinase [Solirubrobacterales bacterium]